MAITKVTTPVTDFNKPNTEEGLKIPSGTVSNQPTGVTGMVRNDTTLSSKGSSSAISYYNGTDWRYFENELNTSFNTVLYTGDASTRSITGVEFQPDLVWIKNRDDSYFHAIFDSIRGANKVISSNNTDSENQYGNWTQQLTSFDSDGFSLGDNSDSGNYVNVSGDDYVAWCFKAGGVEETNTDGTIDSTVRANNDLGFSIVSYTGNGTAGSTVGHGLDSTPEMVIVKSLTTTANQSWSVYQVDVGNNGSLTLELTNTAYYDIGYWNNTSPTSSVFTLGNYAVSNQNNADYIAYSFASKPNYSKTGSYLGNGNATGPIVTLGFEPAFVMIKGVNEASGWTMLDNKRDTSNPNSARLDADSSMAEYNAVGLMDFNSDGFQLKTSQAGQNASGKTYIYLAFANTI